MDHGLPFEPGRPGVRRALGQAGQGVDLTKDGVEGNEAVGSGARDEESTAVLEFLALARPANAKVCCQVEAAEGQAGQARRGGRYFAATQQTAGRLDARYDAN